MGRSTAGNRFRFLRLVAEHGLNQREVAELVGVSPGMVGRWLRSPKHEHHSPVPAYAVKSLERAILLGEHLTSEYAQVYRLGVGAHPRAVIKRMPCPWCGRPRGEWCVDPETGHRVPAPWLHPARIRAYRREQPPPLLYRSRPAVERIVRPAMQAVDDQASQSQ